MFDLLRHYYSMFSTVYHISPQPIIVCITILLQYVLVVPALHSMCDLSPSYQSMCDFLLLYYSMHV